MKLITTLVIFLMATAAWAAPPKCGKYQHVEYQACGSESSVCDMTTGYCSCLTDLPSRCVDDKHVLTEKEWRSINARLRKLESPPVSSDIIATGDATCWSVDECLNYLKTVAPNATGFCADQTCITRQTKPK